MTVSKKLGEGVRWGARIYSVWDGGTPAKCVGVRGNGCRQGLPSVRARARICRNEKTAEQPASQRPRPSPSQPGSTLGALESSPSQRAHRHESTVDRRPRAGGAGAAGVVPGAVALLGAAPGVVFCRFAAPTQSTCLRAGCQFRPCAAPAI